MANTRSRAEARSEHLSGNSNKRDKAQSKITEMRVTILLVDGSQARLEASQSLHPPAMWTFEISGGAGERVAACDVDCGGQAQFWSLLGLGLFSMRKA